MNFIEKYVDDLHHTDRHDIIATYEKFRVDGFVGDLSVRVHARQLCKQMDNIIPITTMMCDLAHECYRYYYRKNFK